MPDLRKSNTIYDVLQHNVILAYIAICIPTKYQFVFVSQKMHLVFEKVVNLNGN